MGLDSVEIVMELEREFRIRVPDDEAERVRTVDDLVGLVVRALKASDDPPVLENAHLRTIVFEKIRDIVAGVIGIDARRVVPSARLHDDLGMD